MKKFFETIATATATTVNTMIVHGGVFHMDDVMCVVLGRTFINPDLRVSRAFKVDLDVVGDDCIVCDIGGVYAPEKKIFDHHLKEQELPLHSDGTPQAACGMLWGWLIPQLNIPEKVCSKFEREILSPISSQDNGLAQNPLSMMINGFNPTWEESSDPAAQMTAFEKAVEVTTTLVERWFEKELSIVRAESIIDEALENREYPELLVLDQFVPTGDRLIDTPVKFVVTPSLRGGWNSTAVKAEVPKGGAFAPNKKDFPMEWVDFPPKGVTFCHKGRFIIACDTKEDAIKRSLEAAAAGE